MSRYEVTGPHQDMVVQVGWLAESPGGYWYAIFESATGQMVDQGGFDEHLTTLADLVAATWPVVDWSADQATLVMLRDDPWVERLTAEPGPPGMAELLADTLTPVITT